MKKTGKLFKWAKEIDGTYYECFIDLETGEEYVILDGVTSTSGK